MALQTVKNVIPLLRFTSGQPVDLDLVNSFFDGVRSSISTISNNHNELLSLVMNGTTLPESGNALDGKVIYVDSEASASKDSGIFYYTPPSGGTSRPLTIYETFLLILQLLGNINNAFSKITIIASKAQPQMLAPNGSATYAAVGGVPFIPLLYYKSGNYIYNANNVLNINYDDTTKQIIITNNSSNTYNIFGYIIHLQLPF